METPAYVLNEKLLRNNLQLIRDTAQEAGVEIILALKAFAWWRTFPIFREYIHHTTASSLNEAQHIYLFAKLRRTDFSANNATKRTCHI